MNKRFRNIIKSVRTKEFRVFSVFVILSLLFWLFSKLNNTFSSTIDVQVNFINIPDNKNIDETNAVLTFDVETTGYQFLRMNIMQPEIEIDVNSEIKEQHGQYYWVSEANEKKISSALNPVQIVQHLTDTLHVIVDEYAEKSIPIKPKYSFNYKANFALTDSISITPNTVRVYGPKRVLDSLQYIETAFFEKNEVEKNILQELQFVKPLSVLKLSKNKGMLKANIEEYVSDEINVSIEIINSPENKRISIFPKEGNVRYKAPISIYNKLSSTDFKLIADYNKKTDSHLEVEIRSIPDHLRSMVLKQKTVAYIVEQ